MSEAVSLLRQFELVVYDQQKRFNSEAVTCLHKILSNLEAIGGDPEQTRLEQFYPRLAHAINALILDSKFILSLSGYQLLCGSHQALSTVFACSDFQDTDYIIARIADVSNPQNLKFKSQSDLMKCLLCYSLRSRFELDIQTLSKQFPDIAAALIVGHLSYNFFANPVIQQKLINWSTNPGLYLKKLILVCRWLFRHRMPG